MIPQTPLPPQQNYQHVQQVQNAQSTGHNIVTSEAMLRALLAQAVAKNDAEQIRTGVVLTDLNTGRVLYRHNQDDKHFAASANKLPVALILLEDLRSGKLTLGQTVTWTAADQRGGFGDFDQPGAPLQATLRQVIQDMLNKSGNTVVRAAVNGLLGGPAAVNERIAARGLSNTSLTVLGPTSFYLGDSTASDSLRALQKITSRNDRYSRFMQRAMATNIFTDFGVRSQLQDDRLNLVNKIGLLDDIDGNNRHDVGIIRNEKNGREYGYAIFTTSPFDSLTATPRAEQSLKDMGLGMLRFTGNKTYSKKYSNQHHHAERWERRVRY